MKKYCIKIRYPGANYPEDNIEILEFKTLKQSSEYARKRAVELGGRILEIFKI